MASERSRRDGEMSRGSIPLDIDDVQLLLQVEQVQIQKRTFTNWVNAQLAKRKPPCAVGELFSDFCDGSRLLDLLEVMSGQRMSRERGRGIFQHRSNIETALNFLKSKSIKLVNINIPDIIDGKPSIILGLIWTIILQYHIEELASSLSFSSRQSSMESLASLDTRSSLSSFSSVDSLSGASPRSSPLPGRRASPLHNRFKVSAKKALLLWVREQCHKAGYTLTVKDFKASWRSGVVFLAILYSLRPDLVDLSKARNRSNLQNLEEAFGLAERELRIPRLLEPCDVDVRDPEEKSIMTYVSQFLQYSRDLPIPEEGVQYLMPPKTHSPINLPVHYTPAVSDSPLRQATPNQKAQEVTCWLLQAYEELLEGWDSTEGESYAERYHVFQTFLVSFNEQRRPVMPLLTAMKRSVKVSEEQRALREAWDALAEKLREYKVQLDVGLPAPLAPVGAWLLRTEGALTDLEPDPLDPGRAAQQARHSQELLNACLEEMPQQVRNFQMFQNVDESGNLLVPTDKLDEMKRRFTSVRVTAKYHGIKLEYQEQRHTVLELLARIRPKLRSWRRPYVSQESVRVLLQEWHELVNEQHLPSLLEAALQKLKHVSGKYSSKSALAADYGQVKQQVEEVEEESQELQEGVAGMKSSLARVLSAWESFSDTLSSLMAWLEQGSLARPPQVSSEAMSEWSSRQTHLNQVGEFLMEVSDPQTTRTLADDLRRINQRWARFLQAAPAVDESEAALPATPPDLQVLIRDAMLILKEPLETMSGPLQTYRKRIQFMLKKMRDVDLETEDFPELSADQRQKLTQAIPEVLQTLSEAEQVCVELQQSVCGLDGRLAELLHWDVEARELYQVLKARERRPQRAQDPRARVFISRGLQLEGQVVTEEQDLQVMVMMSQKNSPVQYVHASAMQHRVRAAVAQSQASTTSKFLLRLISQRRPWESHDSSGMFGYMIPEASTLNSSLTMAF
ncbi:nesprin-2a [Gadus chalcogrammus]|uniref:nesprin-2a n=1 Tax=Gadus chalcogrammus TaxID=1042646 RepID=UPI0024C45F60|nr:nesprin-2a [Gadus chalcogrammus]